MANNHDLVRELVREKGWIPNTDSTLKHPSYPRILMSFYGAQFLIGIKPVENWLAAETYEEALRIGREAAAKRMREINEEYGDLMTFLLQGDSP
jgi:hypothetical protein